ncbi:MAG: DUF2207 domain-containing protein [Pseudolabrys sp.]
MNVFAAKATLRRVAAAFAVLLISAAPALAEEVIQSFNSDVQLAKDGELTVTETIRVNAEGREIRHGVYRDFPLTFRDAGGRHEVSFSLLGVSRDSRRISPSTSAMPSASMPATRTRSCRAACTLTCSATAPAGRCAGSTASRS